MSEVDVLPELKQILGAMLFAAKEPVSLSQMHRVFEQAAEQHGGITKDFAKVTEAHLREALEELRADLEKAKVGVQVREVANGHRLMNDAACGPWLRVLLEKGKANRLSRPALETLAIIAYRQPVVRSEIEAVRGVAVDQIIRNLLDMQLIRVAGRSELPGRPWMFGTTQTFLEHFGLKGLNDLPGTEELRRLENEQIKKQEAAAAQAAEDEPKTEDGITEEPVEEDETTDDAGPDEEEPEDDLDDEDEFEDDDEDDVDEEGDDESR